ncbi:NAD-dependent epimerase/dehydratase family protein [Paracoccus pacificus]|uniref:NAD-dependent epimerase/dehydratase family protein n=1 Tax=Paracoccus pacificus TaxID=1463598 RepID=A0ABW4R9S2_9RHOB
MAHWLITGGAGFIGSHLARRLAALGHDVVVLDNLAQGRAENLNGIPHRLVRGSIGDPAILAELVADAAGIYHLAARVSVQDCIANLMAGHADNVIGSLNVLQAAVAAGRLPVVYASSAAVYGDTGPHASTETMQERPISPYGADKLAVEHHAHAFGLIHGLPTLGLRFFNVYGSGQRPDSAYAGVIPRFVDNARAGRPHTVFGDGQQSRDFVHVDDIVTAMITGMERMQGRQTPEAWLGGFCNVCTGIPTSLIELAAAVDRVIGAVPQPLDFQPARKGDIHYSAGDPAKMQALLGFKPGVALDQGLAEMLKPGPGCRGNVTSP